MPKVTVAASGSIKLLENNQIIELEDDPLMFAVVYQKQGEDDWRPVYGDPIHGWHVEPDSNWDSVLRAAKANPYVFQLTSNGSYQVTIENLPPGEEAEIIIRANTLSQRVMNLLHALQMENEKLMLYHEDGSMSVLHPDSVYYFESVDNKVFAYGKSEVSELKQKLYKLEQRFAGTDFIRISKSMILNLAKVERFAPSFSGRFEAILQNGEKVMISRQYVPALKKQLGL